MHDEACCMEANLRDHLFLNTELLTQQKVFLQVSLIVITFTTQVSHLWTDIALNTTRERETH